MKAYTRKDLQEIMLAIAECDEESDADGLCTCARFIGLKLEKYSDKTWHLERIKFLENAVNKYRKALQGIKEMADTALEEGEESYYFQIEADARAALGESEA